MLSLRTNIFPQDVFGLVPARISFALRVRNVKKVLIMGEFVMS